jgi:CRISPR-associated protein Csx16
VTTWFISRHPGAVEWVRRRGLPVDQYVAHLDTAHVQPGDTVIGSLPVNLAAAICERGARYLHLSLELPAALRGQELSADQLEDLGAEVQEYRVENATRILCPTVECHDERSSVPH